MKVALISEHANPLAAMGTRETGGQNRHVGSLGAAIAAMGNNVRIYTRWDHQHQETVTRIRPGLDIVAVPAGPAAPVPRDELPAHMPEFAAWLRDRFVTEPPDVVHANFWMSGAAALPICRDMDIPFVQTFHALGTVKRRNLGSLDPSPADRIRIEQLLGQEADAVIATCSDEVAELAAMQVRGERVHVIPCGIAQRTFTPVGPVWPRSSAMTHRVLYLGRLVARKGIDTLVKAMASRTDTELVIAGGPDRGGLAADPDARRIMNTALWWGVTDRLRMLGRIDPADVPSLLRSADVVVNVPAYEPFGMVPLEAMACGVPVVASAVGGMLDTVNDRVTGRLVPPDDVSALRGALADLLDDPGRRRRMGAKAATAAARYGWPEIAARTVRVYTALREQASATPSTPTARAGLR